jgi:hypothetical protein
MSEGAPVYGAITDNWPTVGEPGRVLPARAGWGGGPGRSFFANNRDLTRPPPHPHPTPSPPPRALLQRDRLQLPQHPAPQAAAGAAGPGCQERAGGGILGSWGLGDPFGAMACRSFRPRQKRRPCSASRAPSPLPTSRLCLPYLPRHPASPPVPGPQTGCVPRGGQVHQQGGAPDRGQLPHGRRPCQVWGGARGPGGAAGVSHAAPLGPLSAPTPT